MTTDPVVLQRRIAAKVKVCEFSGCHHWLGAIGCSGTPHMQLGDRVGSVRRWLWTRYHGKRVPTDRVVSTVCGNPFCVNPAHATVASWSQLGHRRAQWRHPYTPVCKHGHPRWKYLHVTSDNKMACRECTRLAVQRWRQRHQEGENGN